MIEIDLEQRLRMYMPSMFRLLGTGNLSKRKWKKINQKFIEVYNERTEDYKSNNNHLQVKANLYDLIISMIKGNASAARLLGYFDVLFKSLDNNLAVEQKPLVRNSLFNVLVEMDHNFRNYIGELSVLNNILEGGKYKLLGIESDIISQNKTADFTLEDDLCNKELVEVLNIHIDSSEYINETLQSKIEEKVGKKTSAEDSYNEFTLVPVIWAPVNVLQDIATLYKSGLGFKMNYVHEPLAYCVFSDPNNLLIYRFCSVSRLFPDGQILVKWVD